MNEKEFSWTVYFISFAWGIVIGFIVGAFLL